MTERIVLGFFSLFSLQPWNEFLMMSLSFFIRTVSVWNNLTEEVVSAKSVEEFQSLISTQH